MQLDRVSSCRCLCTLLESASEYASCASSACTMYMHITYSASRKKRRKKEEKKTEEKKEEEGHRWLFHLSGRFMASRKGAFIKSEFHSIKFNRIIAAIIQSSTAVPAYPCYPVMCTFDTRCSLLVARCSLLVARQLFKSGAEHFLQTFSTFYKKIFITHFSRKKCGLIQ